MVEMESSKRPFLGFHSIDEIKVGKGRSGRSVASRVS